MNHQELIDKAAIRLCPIGIKLIHEEHPVEASRGGRNTVFHHCDVYQGRPSYASCLAIIELKFNGVEDKLRPECFAAMDKGECPAIEMRKAELRAGRALFYVDYVELSKQRQVQWAADRENSEIQFRRRKPGAGFKPTVFSAKELEDREAKIMQMPDKKAPVEVTDSDYNLNIMEQVAKKVLNDNTN